MENIETSASFDDMVITLADIRRRKLLLELLERDPGGDSPVAVADTGRETDAAERRMQMRHVHLPKLADRGFVTWNERTHEATRGPKFDEIEPLLELLAAHEDELPSDWI